LSALLIADQADFARRSLDDDGTTALNKALGVILGCVETRGGHVAVLRSIVGYDNVEEMSDTKPRRTRFLESRSGRFPYKMGFHHGLFAKTHRVSGLSSIFWREKVTLIPSSSSSSRPFPRRRRRPPADLLGSLVQYHLLSSRFRLTSKRPRTKAINTPELHP
jgi:hypothetical protein